MTVFDQPQAAVRLNDVLIDPDTGEILSEHDIGIDTLAMQLKDATEQKRAWEQTEQLLKLAIGRKLDAANAKAAETPYGVATWRVQVRRSAGAARFREMAAEYGLDDECARDIISAAASALDPKLLDSFTNASLLEGEDDLPAKQVRSAIAATIEEKTVAYVLLQPLRKAAPRIEREFVE